MRQVKDLYPLVAGRTARDFLAEVGPFFLIQQPPAPVLANVAMTLGAGRTVGAVHRSRLGDEILAMLEGFKNLRVVNLPPLDSSQEMLVGRLPECAILVEEPSVSKHHALLRWDAGPARCFLKDLGSLNGTFVNTRQIAGEEVELFDGDALSFGDAHFLYMMSSSLYEQLLTIGASMR